MKKLLKILAIAAGILGILNPVIGFATVNFDIAVAYANPEMVLSVINQPFWREVGMPLFLFTDSVGWYILPPILVIWIANSFELKSKKIIVVLAIIYAIVGNLGVMTYANAYIEFISAPSFGPEFLEITFYVYDVIWGTVNNFVGGTMFILIGVQIFQHSKRMGVLNVLAGSIMLLAAISYSLGFSSFAGTVLNPIYLVLFPLNISFYRIEE